MIMSNAERQRRYRARNARNETDRNVTETVTARYADSPFARALTGKATLAEVKGLTAQECRAILDAWSEGRHGEHRRRLGVLAERHRLMRAG